jgi:hypothetical protein
VKRWVIYGIIFVVAVGTTVYVDWHPSPIHYLVGFLMFAMPFLLIPYARALELPDPEMKETFFERNAFAIA